VGIGHGAEACAAGEGGIAVLHLGRGGGVHCAVVGLVLGRELTEAVVGALDLVHYRGAGGVGGAGQLLGQALGVVGRAETSDRSVYAAAQRADGVAGEPAEHVAGEGVDVPVAVLLGEDLAEAVVGEVFVF